ncbi:TaqI-like C-terminal specificity domain-containing protein [Streptosporangium canum]|uniref:site-specific DNA-methyltransferase (adenine-specific) n=2 Tax=Streptosporangium canum TaxID=324952 RepID=A0A1I4FC92_9ACTN|nr:TaqI-like C-terminal specificity domain-containing protein [Streptosporangium canum]
MILDLVGYRSDQDLSLLRLVEPACGTGAFLGVIAQRVSNSCRKHERDITDALDAVRASDLLPRNVAASRALVERILTAEGWASNDASRVAQAWVRRADYLLEQPPGTPQVDVVVGNPPYIRLEDLPEERMSLYRALWPTMVGRADIYVGFFEAALRSLRAGGRLGFICADRWMRNQYGRELRKLVGDEFALDACVTMHDVDAFEEQVSAYPAVTVLRRGVQESAVVADTTSRFGETAAQDLLSWIGRREDRPFQKETFEAARMPHWFSGDDMWPTGSPARLAVLEDLTERFTVLGQASGVRVGIGIATGADKVFITRDPDLVEADRLLQMSMVRDTTSGHLEWSGHYLVNPWDDNGHLVDLKQHPKLWAYFMRNAAALRGRYVAKKNPEKWYKTIDKVESGLRRQPKLLFPDMKLSSHPVLDKGGEDGFYPHHNLYFITSDVWDLEVLGGILLSKVAEAFVDAYAVKMRGKTLRFQAQYIRRIPVPDPAVLTSAQKERLIDAFRKRDVEAATSAAMDVYNLTEWPG